MAESSQQFGEGIEVVNNVEDRYYELRVDGSFAGMVLYVPFGSRYVLTHTVIGEAFRGRGLSKVLIRAALDDIRDRHLTFTSYCKIVDYFIEEHPEYADLVDPAHPSRWPDPPAA